MRASLLRSGVLRLALLAAALFAIGALVVASLVHVAVTAYARGMIADQIQSEIDIVRGEDATRGRVALLGRLDAQKQVFFRLDGRDGRHVAGDLPAAAGHLGWGTSVLPDSALLRHGPQKDPGERENDAVMTYGMRLGDGSLLVVGRGLYELDEFVEWLDRAALWSALGVVVLALAGGALVARDVSRRIARVNAAVQRIRDGSFAERLPAIGLGAEIDRLADQVNAMLDRILSLMDGHRQLSITIAHDLRMPLTRVRQQLERTAATELPSDARDAVDAATGQLDDLLSTFAALLRLGTIETGALRGRFRRVDVTALLTEVAATFAPVAEDRGKTLAAHLAPGLAVSGDPDLLMQLFINVVENALVHSADGRHVTIAASRIGDEATVEIVDDGPGVPAGERDAIFDRFHRTSAAEGTPGSGLGLALVKAIATLHRATITVADAGPGLRVCFVCAAL